MRNIFTGIVFIILLILGNRNTNAQSFDWALGIGGSDADGVNSITVDSIGNIYITGFFRQTVDFDPGPGVVNLVSSNGSYDIFIAKYDVNGTLLWAHGIGNIGQDRGNEITLDNNGNVYVVGYFANTVDFDPGSSTVNLISNGGSDAFMAKYDSEGNFLWAKNMGGSAAEFGKSIAIYGRYAYIAGQFRGKADFDPGPDTAYLTPRSQDFFVAKYDTNGNYLWAMGIGGSGIDFAQNIAVDTAGNVYVTGSFPGTVDFDPGPGIANLISNGGTLSNIFVAKYDANGNYVWAFAMGGTAGSTWADGGNSIALDDSGYVYVAGSFNGPADFDPDPLDSAVLAGVQGAFIAKYDANGNYIWAKGTTGGSAQGNSIVLNIVGNVYFTGRFGGDIDFDPGPDTTILRCTSISYTDMFIAKYDAHGNCVWAKQVGGLETEEGNSIAANLNGDIYVGGIFHAIVDFDPGSGVFNLVSNNGTSDAFILKLSCDSPTAQLIKATVCDSSFALNGIVYSANGTYSQMYFAVDGCDSMIILDLILNQIDKPFITVNGFELSTTGSYVTYQWIKNDTPIPGATNSTYNVDENADYRVAVANEDGCTDTSDIYTVTNWEDVSIDHLQLAKSIHIYPNPANDIVYIQSPVQVTAHLTDMAGRTIKEINDIHSISVKDVNAGIYLLQIRNKEGLLINTVKLVKK